MAKVRVWIANQGPFISSAGNGIRTDKVPSDPLDVLRLADAGSLVGFKTVAVAGQENLEADASGQTLTLAAGLGLEITTDPVNDTVEIGIIFGAGAGQACQGNDPRLSDTRTPAAHAASHEPGGSDPVICYLVDN